MQSCGVPAERRHKGRAQADGAPSFGLSETTALLQHKLCAVGRRSTLVTMWYTVTQGYLKADRSSLRFPFMP